MNKKRINFEEYEKLHSDIMAAAQREGVVFPIRVDERWIHPKSRAPWETDEPFTWNTRYPEFIPGHLAEVMVKAQGRVSSLQDNLDRYFAESGGTTPIEQGLWLGSVEGAKRFAECDLTRCLRVVLEHKATEDPHFNQFGDTLVIAGTEDSGTPTTPDPSITRVQFAQMAEALARANKRLDDGDFVLVHCSQGQSRSAMFVIALLMLRAADGKRPEFEPSSWEHLAEWAVNVVSHKRNMTLIDPRWLTLVMALAIMIFETREEPEYSSSDDE